LAAARAGVGWNVQVSPAAEAADAVVVKEDNSHFRRDSEIGVSLGSVEACSADIEDRVTIARSTCSRRGDFN
jgi:hypothetical protein